MRSKLANRSRWEVTRSRIGRSDFERGALDGHLDRAAERLRGLVARLVGVELVRDVDEEQALGPGVAAVVAGLLRREVAAHARPLGTRERGLDEHQVGVTGE